MSLSRYNYQLNQQRQAYQNALDIDGDPNLLAAASVLLASVREFVELYAGISRDSLGPSVQAKLRRADAAIAKAEGK